MSEPGSLIRTLTGRAQARNYHSYVINEVGLAILSGEMPVGSILPSDAEMMERFGVSRTVLREALKTLEAKGLVEARARVGTRVLPQSRWSFYDRQVLTWCLESGPAPALLGSFEVIRRAVELEGAALAAEHRDSEQIRMMHYWLNQRAAMGFQIEPFALAEFEFHRLVSEASQNPFLRAAGGVIEFGVALAAQAALGPDQEVPQEGLAAAKSAAYLELLSGIEAGSGARAREAMTVILKHDHALVAG